jgi:hypothetical protein
MTEQTKPACAALQLTDGWKCEKCALAWDDGDRRPPCEPLTFTRLKDAALGEAERIEQSQWALTMGGLNDPPINKFRNLERLKRAMELRALARMVDKVRAGTATKLREEGKGHEAAHQS